LREYNHECAVNCPLGERYIKTDVNCITSKVFFILLEEGEKLS
jgi:hypothetical protein